MQRQLNPYWTPSHPPSTTTTAKHHRGDDSRNPLTGRDQHSDGAGIRNDARPNRAKTFASTKTSLKEIALEGLRRGVAALDDLETVPLRQKASQPSRSATVISWPPKLRQPKWWAF